MGVFLEYSFLFLGKGVMWLASFLFFKLNQVNKMEKVTTNRGFSLIKFKDRYNNDCSIQESSLATEDCIWIGIDDPNPQIMASQAKEFGVETNETTGWVDYPIPEEVSLNTRMHITRDQAKEIIEVLQIFVETGEI